MNLRKDHYWMKLSEVVAGFSHWSMCTLCLFFQPLHCCALLMGSSCGMKYNQQLFLCVFFKKHTSVCLRNVIHLCIIAYKYNFQQRISWLSHRWRTQRNAISNVNCRIQWIIESLNAPCAPWYSEEHACLSVMVFSNLLCFFFFFKKKNTSSFGLGGKLLAFVSSSEMH